MLAGLAEVCGVLNVAHARLVDLVVAALETRCWEGYGILTCEQWVAWQTGLSPARARQVVAMARRRDVLPETFSALAGGELAVDQVAVIVDRVPDRYEADVATLARSATVSQLRRTVGPYQFGEADNEEQVRTDATYLSRGFDGDGRYRLRAVLDPDQGAVVDAALNEAHDAVFHAGQPDVTGSDALVEMARRSLGTVTSVDRRDAFAVYVHLHTDRPGAYLHHGPGLPDALARQLLCDTRGAIVGLRGGRPVNVGRTRRIVPTHTRRLVQDRDRGCRVPGCTRSNVEIHHIVHWLDHGPTDLPNHKPCE